MTRPGLVWREQPLATLLRKDRPRLGRRQVAERVARVGIVLRKPPALGNCAEPAPPRHAKHLPAALAVAFRGSAASVQTPIAPESASSLRPSMTSIPLPHFEPDVGEGIYQVLLKKLPLHSGTLTTGET